MATDFTNWKDKFLFWLMTGLMGLMVPWSAWVTVSLLARPDRSETKSIIQMESPYVRDQKLLESQVQSFKLVEDRLSRVIDRNTQAIEALRLELAKKGK